MSRSRSRRGLPIPNDPSRVAVSALTFAGTKSRTVKSAAYDTDINNMVKGLSPFSTSRKSPFYIDETLLPESYEASFNAVLDAQDAFMSLPAEVREIFANNPANLARSMADPANRKFLTDLGILEAQGGERAPQSESESPPALSGNADSPPSS